MEKILSLALNGLSGSLVEVETYLQASLPSVSIVGLPDPAVAEAKERVKIAIRASGLSFPRGRVVVNLAPAPKRKQGSVYDLSIAISILTAQRLVQVNSRKAAFIGELGLSGELRPVTGVITLTKVARTLGINELFLPQANAVEARLISGIKILPARNLIEVVEHLKGQRLLAPFSGSVKTNESSENFVDEIVGQETAKRALMIAAAGKHNLLLIGPPGAGKTVLAKTISNYQFPLSLPEAIEVAEIYSLAGMINREQPVRLAPPIRMPHHTASLGAMIGGINVLRPGEVSLAHHGVLLLDEIAEFNRGVLESLREPLEEKVISICRAAGRYQFPAEFQLIGTLNPCPCGNLGSPFSACRCLGGRIRQYWQKLSGPLLDRVDLFVWVNSENLIYDKKAKSLSDDRTKILKAKKIQQARGQVNGALKLADLRSAILGQESVLEEITARLKLSSRGYIRLLRVARTIADLEGAEMISASHLGEALQYRLNLDEMLRDYLM